MHQATQIELTQRLFEYIDSGSTATFDQAYEQPVTEYIDTDIAARENDLFFRESPLCVGMSALLPKPATYFTHDLGPQPLLLTRDADGKARAFLNVCRHRGARVAEDCGAKRLFSCPYHAWTYGLDGKIVARPEEQAFASVPRCTHGLTELAMTECDGLLWVMPGTGQALDLDQHLGTLGEELGQYNLGGFHHYKSVTLKRRMNWKLMVDTFLESYHFCVLHKDSICSIFYDNITDFKHWGKHYRIASPRRTINDMREQSPEQWDLLPHVVAIYILFPNTVLVWQLDHIELWQIFPGEDAPDEAVANVALYTPEPATSDRARNYWDKNLDLVIGVVENEDFPVGEGIQRGFYSGAQSHITFGCNEPALTHYHRYISEELRLQRESLFTAEK